MAWHFDPARELGGDICDFLSPEANTLVVVLGDVSGKGVPAALYGAAIGEMVRGRTFRRRLEKKETTPAELLAGMNRILHERNLEEYYCTLCYAMFEFKKKTVTFANSGLPFPVKFANGKAEQLEMPGTPLGSFGGSQYDDFSFRSKPAISTCCVRTGFSRRSTRPGRNSAPGACIDVIERTSDRPSKEMVHEIFAAVQQFCGDAPQSDDRTVVVVKINQLGPSKTP